jgi:hypothetical protein
MSADGDQGFGIIIFNIIGHFHTRLFFQLSLFGLRFGYVFSVSHSVFLFLSLLVLFLNHIFVTSSLLLGRACNMYYSAITVTQPRQKTIVPKP